MAESRESQSSVWGQKWYGQLCACGKDSGSVQLNRLGEVGEGNADCAAKAVVVFSSLFRLGSEEEMCSGGVWLVVMGGRSCSRDVDGCRAEPILLGLAP